MKKLIRVLCLVGFAAFALSGCVFNHEHNRAHVRSFLDGDTGDIEEMHKFIDKYFFNFDERDPDKY